MSRVGGRPKECCLRRQREKCLRKEELANRIECCLRQVTQGLNIPRAWDLRGLK